MQMRRADDPELKSWRKAVRRRDRRQCQFPGCSVKIKLQCHHIYRWADYYELRYDINNGILLCAEHHKLVTGNEMLYASIFVEIVYKRKRC